MPKVTNHGQPDEVTVGADGGMTVYGNYIGGDSGPEPVPGSYTVGTGKTYSTIQAGVDAIPDILGGTGVSRVEVYQNASWDGTKCYYPEEVDAYTGFSGSSATDYVEIVAMEKHEGLRDKGIVVNPVPLLANQRIIHIRREYFELEGFGITLDGTNNNYVTSVDGYTTGCKARKCLIYDVATTNLRVYGFQFHAEGLVENCAAINLTTPNNNSIGFYGYPVGSTSNFNNCTAINCIGSSNQHEAFFAAAPSPGIMYCTNCIAAGINKFYTPYTAAQLVLNNCLSQDSSADNWGGANNLVDQDSTTDTKLTSIVVGSEDIHLSDTSSTAYGAGVAVSGVTDDIDWDTRSDPPSIGADEG